MERGAAIFKVFLKTRINQHHSLATEEKRQTQAVGQRRLIGKGKSNQPRGGGNSLGYFPSPQPLPGEEDQRKEFSLLAVADKTPDPATGFACWEPPDICSNAIFQLFQHQFAQNSLPPVSPCQDSLPQPPASVTDQGSQGHPSWMAHHHSRQTEKHQQLFGLFPISATTKTPTDSSGRISVIKGSHFF